MTTRNGSQYALTGRWYLLALLVILVWACGTDPEAQARKEAKERERLEEEHLNTAFQLFEAQLREKKQKEQQQAQHREDHRKQIMDQYLGNALKTGDMPYAYCYGKNRSCVGAECSYIIIHSMKDKDLLAIIQRKGKAFQHAYIRRGESHTFAVPNGTYVPYCYFGLGWYPEMRIKEEPCGVLRGGFLADAAISTEKEVTLNNQTVKLEPIPVSGQR
jgi:hypothetical protein